MNLTDIINNGRAPSESDMNGNDNIVIVIDKPDQRSALDQDCDRKFWRTLKVNKQGTHTIKKYN